MPTATNQLFRGTLHVLILKTLQSGELHGYAIVSRIQKRTGGVFAIEDGALYQALHRMEERGWLESAWGRAETGKRARFYQLTGDGKRQLGFETKNWIQYADAVFNVLQLKPA